MEGGREGGSKRKEGGRRKGGIDGRRDSQVFYFLCGCL